MGVSLSRIPERVDRETFERLYRENGPLPEYQANLSLVFDKLADDDELIDRNLVLSLANATDLYLAHEWGYDSNGRSTHDRVGLLNTAFQKAGMITWFDEDRESRSTASMLSPTEIMKEGIRGTQIMIVFITERYVELVSENFKDEDLDVFYGMHDGGEEKGNESVREVKSKAKQGAEEKRDEGLGQGLNFDEGDQGAVDNCPLLMKACSSALYSSEV